VRDGGKAEHPSAFSTQEKPLDQGRRLLTQDIAVRISSTGASLPWLNYDQTANTTFKAPTHQVGGGLVDARNILNYTTSVQLQRFSLNDTANFRATHSIIILNNGTGTVDYTFEVEPWAGFDMLHTDPNDVDESPRIRYIPEMEGKDFGINVQLPADLKMKPGEFRTVTYVMTISLPSTSTQTV
jgi:hypothetical protein